MKNILSRFALFLSLSACTFNLAAVPHTLAAETPRPPFNRSFELSTGGLAGFSMATVAGTDVFSFTYMSLFQDSRNVVGMPSPSLGYFLTPRLEAVLSINLFSALRKTSPVSVTTTLYKFSAGLSYNFSDDIENSFYVRGEAGFAVLGNSGVDETDFLFNAQVGKRFRLMDNFSWVPAIVFERVATLPVHSMGLSFVPVQFSIFL